MKGLQRENRRTWHCFYKVWQNYGTNYFTTRQPRFNGPQNCFLPEGILERPVKRDNGLSSSENPNPMLVPHWISSKYVLLIPHESLVCDMITEFQPCPVRPWQSKIFNLHACKGSRTNHSGACRTLHY